MVKQQNVAKFRGVDLIYADDWYRWLRIPMEEGLPIADDNRRRCRNC
jgi:hypothetical protein